MADPIAIITADRDSLLYVDDSQPFACGRHMSFYTFDTIDGSHRKAGGVIGLPYLDGRQHVEMPEVPRG